jgi:predicted homoserine dehydrogenase-like protein
VILVDTALAQRERDGKPVTVALVGAGFSGRTIAYQILSSFPAIRLVAICNRTIPAAIKAYAAAGQTHARAVDSSFALEEAMSHGRFSVTDDPAVICDAGGIDAIIETTGTVDFAAGVVLRAVQHGKHAILVNAELDATLGPVLKTYADRSGVIYTNTDGDEPGVAMNMLRFVKAIGVTPVVAGNLKGLYDRYRTPATQRAFAEASEQPPKAVSSFADGTKLSMELTVLANASGFTVAMRGMYGPALQHVNEAGAFFRDRLIPGGMVDFLVGAAPSSGAFVLGYTDDPVKAAYLKYLKMGDGPLYTFYTPFHLPQLEVPLTVARAVLFGDATVTPLGGPVCEAIAVAKRNLKVGDVLDGFGGFASYALVDTYHQSRNLDALPMGVSEGCRLVRDVRKDQALTYADVQLPPGRLCDTLRREQDDRFACDGPGSSRPACGT